MMYEVYFKDGDSGFNRSVLLKDVSSISNFQNCIEFEYKGGVFSLNEDMLIYFKTMEVSQ